MQIYNRVLSSNEVVALYREDTRGNGLSNVTEVKTYGTDPSKADSDGDGMPDGWEVAHGLTPTSDDASADPDGDGYSNFEEWVAGTDPNDPGSYPDKHPSALLTIPNSWAIYLSSNTVQVSADIRSTNHYVTVQSAEVFLDSPGTNGTGLAMTLSGYNSTNVTAQATFTPGFAYGERHELFVHAKGRDNQWSPFQKIILNPNINDILDKIQTNYSQIQDITYTTTRKKYFEGQVAKTETIQYRQKGPHKLRWDNLTTGAITIVNEGGIGIIDEHGHLTPLLLIVDGGGQLQPAMMNQFYWDIENFKTQHDIATVTATNSPGSYRLSATPKVGTAAQYEGFVCEVDFRIGAVVGFEFWEDEELALIVEQPVPREVASGVWFHSEQNSIIPVSPNWELRQDEVITNDSIELNVGTLSDSLFDF